MCSRILFDRDSQRTFITRKLVSQLQCEPICKESLSISSFGENGSNISYFDLVSVGLESVHETFQVEALVANTISAPVPMKIEES